MDNYWLQQQINEMSALANMMKRFIDICAGIVGCLILIPLTVFVKYKYVKSGDHDSIIFSQDRIGKNGKMIKIYNLDQWYQMLKKS